MYHPFFHPLLHPILSLLKRRRLPLGGLMRLAVCCVILFATQGVAHAQFTLTQTLLNPTPAASDYFGFSVSVDGDRVLVGAYGDDTGATDAGAAYLFDAVTGVLLHTFTNPTPAGGDLFGWSVSVDGDRILVGAVLDDTGASDAGAAYLFDAVTGVLLQTFTNSTPAGGDLFGYSVSVNGDRVLVGAMSDDTGTTDAGAAYLFDAVTGVLLQTFTNPTPAQKDS
ncbi:FG-GAP repeat protein, partial [Candidatus Poribacteria bacterium]|nr:FG-GAP repeat protein [Candidatus Poribacteria bacterium]